VSASGQMVEAAIEAPPPAAPPASGARSGALLAVASGVSIVINYVFLLAAGRILGSDAYGSLAALLGLLAVVLIPAGAVQMAVSREISRLNVSGRAGEAEAFARSALRLALIATVPLVAVALALAVPLDALLHIHATGIVALAELTLASALVFPVAMGVLQGGQRFRALAVLYVFPMALRLALLAIVAGVGYRLGGAVLASVVAVLAGTGLALALIREPLRRGAHRAPVRLGPFLRYLAPVGVGLIGIALLTHADILIVKARFPGDDAGAYGAASAFARVGFFVPATILAVLFPRTAARQARGEETEDILGRSLLATAGFCGALALFYAATGVGLVTASFGRDFATGGKILAPYALAMGFFSLAQILVGYHLSRGETRYAWIVAAGVLVQITVLATVPSTLHGLVWANASIAAALVVAHEVFVESSAPALRAGLRHLRAPLARARALVPETALVLTGTTLFVCALFWRVVRHLGSTVIGSPGTDSTGAIASLWELRHTGGYHILGITHHTLSGAPFGWDETNAVNLQTFLAYYPEYLIAHVVGDVAAFNLVTLAGYVLSGATMYLLVRCLGCGRAVASWAALAFMVFPYHFAHQEHASLLHLEVLVLVLLALVAFARTPSWPRLALVAAANLSCWLMSGYYGPMAAVASVAFAVGVAVTSGRRRWLVLVAGTVAAVLAASAVPGIAALASGTNAGVGLKRAVGDLSIFGLRPLQLVVPPPGNIVLGDRLQSFWIRHAHGSNQTEIVGYLGLLTIALALAWLVVAIRRWRQLGDKLRVATAGLAFAFVAALAFAAPNPILLFGHKVSTPARLLWEIVPAFRVLSRWDAFLMTALVPLGALGLQAAAVRLRRSPRGYPLALPLVGVAMVFSFLELTGHPANPHWRTVPVPQEYTALSRTPPGILAEYPLGYSDIYRMWQRKHGRPLFNGAPAETPADYVRLAVLDPAQQGTAESLALLGVTAIGIHPGAHVDAEVLPREPTHDSGYKLIGRFPDGASMWQVVARPAAAVVSLPGGFEKPERAEDGSVAFPLISSAGVGVIELAALKPGVVQLSFEAAPPKGTTRPLRVADSHTEQAFTLSARTTVSVLVEIPRGRSLLLVKTDPPAKSLADAILISPPRAAPSTGQPALHADLISPNPGF
jgi:O-antigen/teichoic acid export membrane protein